MATVCITGGTGLVGKALTSALLEKGDRVIVLTRDQKLNQTGFRSPAALSYAHWDINKQTIDQAAIASADHLVHLAGAAVADKRWTGKRKEEILNSRVKSAELLVKAMQEIPNSIKSVVSASAIGWYGPDPVIPNPDPFREEQPASNDFLGRTCQAWEQSLVPVTELGKRLVIFRTGIVLSGEGGFIREFLKPIKFGIAPILGNGNQVISWVGIDDLVRLYIAAITTESMEGVYNAVAPAPVAHKKLLLQLARNKRGSFFIPVYIPSFLLKLVLGEMSIEVLKSVTVSCDKLHREGFTFLHPSIESALKSS